MSDRSIAVLALVALIVASLAGYTWYSNHSMSMTMDGMQQQNTMNMESNKDGAAPLSDHSYAKNIIKPKEGQPIKTFTLEAKSGTLHISQNKTIPVWTFNGTVPGPVIRVKQGDYVKVIVKNTLSSPITVHWHGYPVISGMDGIPGVTQDAIQTGETFTYEFSADVPGTYWYHSHQQGAKEVDKGLYGALIVDPKEGQQEKRDYTLILDEWMPNQSEDMNMSGMASTNSMSGMSGMDDMTDMKEYDSPIPDMGANNAAPVTEALLKEETMMKDQYSVFTVNGKSGKLIDPLYAVQGETIRVRLINAGYRAHGIHVPNESFKVISTDGQTIVGAAAIKDQVIMIGPGERYDLLITVTSKNNFYLDFHDSNKYNDQIKIPVIVEYGTNQFKIGSAKALKIFDLSTYDKSENTGIKLTDKFDIDYNMELGAKLDDKGLLYTINGKTFKDAPSLKVKTGDLVKMTILNKSPVDHPMHLHGHFFQVLAKDDVPISGTIMKDTLLIRPGEKYVIAFRANNPGRWVQHCHELHHAAAGMMQMVEYTDYKLNYTPNPKDTFNKPE
ncbi:MAG: multicopper oxidase family protein [Candidatus Saccharibacteria bacterium]